jgi:hypothetical protein
MEPLIIVIPKVALGLSSKSASMLKVFTPVARRRRYLSSSLVAVGIVVAILHLQRLMSTAPKISQHLAEVKEPTVFFVPVKEATHYCALKLWRSVADAGILSPASSDDIPRFRLLLHRRHRFTSLNSTFDAMYHTPIRPKYVLNVMRTWLFTNQGPSNTVSPGEQLIKWNIEDAGIAAAISPYSRFVVFGSKNGIAEYRSSMDTYKRDCSQLKADAIPQRLACASIEAMSNAEFVDCAVVYKHGN